MLAEGLFTISFHGTEVLNWLAVFFGFAPVAALGLAALDAITD